VGHRFLVASWCLAILENTIIEATDARVIINDNSERINDRQLGDLPSSHKSPKGQASKPQFSMTMRDYIGLSAAVLGLVLAAGGGTGGGGILVPIYILVLDFPVKIAIPLSAVTVLGGAIANSIVNAKKRHPEYPSRSIIDWEIILQMCPPAIAGALIGAVLNHVLREIVLIIMLLGVLGFTAYKTLKKACSLYEKESLDKREEQKTVSEEYDSILENGRAEKTKSVPGQYGAFDSKAEHHESRPSNH